MKRVLSLSIVVAIVLGGNFLASASPSQNDIQEPAKGATDQPIVVNNPVPRATSIPPNSPVVATPKPVIVSPVKAKVITPKDLARTPIMTTSSPPRTVAKRPVAKRPVAKRPVMRTPTVPRKQVAKTPMQLAGLDNNWTQIFADDFTVSSMSKAWSYRYLGIKCCGRTKSVSSKDAVTFGDGSMRLKVLGKNKDGLYRNGHVSTDGKFAFKYGTVAARIKFPRHQGMHGSLWLQPTAGQTVGRGSEIDVVEFFGEGFSGGGLSHNIYQRDAAGKQHKYGGLKNSNNLLKKGQTWWNSYHVFSVEWTSKVYIFRIDGVETYRTSRGVSNQEQYLILSTLTSDWELPKLKSSYIPSEMRVDWVRVWQRK